MDCRSFLTLIKMSIKSFFYVLRKTIKTCRWKMCILGKALNLIHSEQKANLQRRMATFYNTIMDLIHCFSFNIYSTSFKRYIVSLLWSHISDRKVAVSSVDNFSLCIYFSSHKIRGRPYTQLNLVHNNPFDILKIYFIIMILL